MAPSWLPPLSLLPSRRHRPQRVPEYRRTTLEPYNASDRRGSRRQSVDGAEFPLLQLPKSELPSLWTELRSLCHLHFDAVPEGQHQLWSLPRQPGMPGRVFMSWAAAVPTHVGGMVYFPDIAEYLFAGEPFNEEPTMEHTQPQETGPYQEVLVPESRWTVHTFTATRGSGPEQRPWVMQAFCYSALETLSPGHSPRSQQMWGGARKARTQKTVRTLLRLYQRTQPIDNTRGRVNTVGAVTTAATVMRKTRKGKGAQAVAGPVRKPLDSEVHLKDTRPFIFRRLLQHPIHVLVDSSKLIYRGLRDFSEMRLLYASMHRLVTRVRRVQRRARGWLACRRAGMLRSRGRWEADEDRRIQALIDQAAEQLAAGDKLAAFKSRLEAIRLPVPESDKFQIISAVQSSQLREVARGARNANGPTSVFDVPLWILRRRREQLEDTSSRAVTQAEAEAIRVALDLAPQDLEHIMHQVSHTARRHSVRHRQVVPPPPEGDSRSPQRRASIRHSLHPAPPQLPRDDSHGAGVAPLAEDLLDAQPGRSFRMRRPSYGVIQGVPGSRKQSRSSREPKWFAGGGGEGSSPSAPEHSGGGLGRSPTVGAAHLGVDGGGSRRVSRAAPCRGWLTTSASNASLGNRSDSARGGGTSPRAAAGLSRRQQRGSGFFGRGAADGAGEVAVEGTHMPGRARSRGRSGFFTAR